GAATPARRTSWTSGSGIGSGLSRRIARVVRRMSNNRASLSIPGRDPCQACLAVRGESTNGRVASAGGPYARRGGAGDVGAYRRAAATKQTAPRRRNPQGAWVLRAIAALLLLDDPHRDRLRRRALRSPHNTPARDRLYSHHGLLVSDRAGGGGRGDGAELARARAEILQGQREVLLREIGPQLGSEVKLG